MRFLNWLKNKFSPRQKAKHTDLRQTRAHLRQIGSHRKTSAAQTAKMAIGNQPEIVDVDSNTRARIVSPGQGKNVPIRNKYIREDTGTHDNLKIIDETLIETDDEAGIDPYNTGQFDRSKNWDTRFRN